MRSNEAIQADISNVQECILRARQASLSEHIVSELLDHLRQLNAEMDGKLRRAQESPEYPLQHHTPLRSEFEVAAAKGVDEFFRKTAKLQSTVTAASPDQVLSSRVQRTHTAAIGETNNWKFPTSINGCGVHFYGKANAVSLNSGGYLLEEFDTVQWLTLLWLPILPLRTPRIRVENGTRRMLGGFRYIDLGGRSASITLILKVYAQAWGLFAAIIASILLCDMIAKAWK